MPDLHSITASLKTLKRYMSLLFSLHLEQNAGSLGRRRCDQSSLSNSDSTLMVGRIIILPDRNFRQTPSMVGPS